MKTVAVICLLVALAVAKDAPVLPSQFSLWFDETAKLISTGTTKGVIYYDETHNQQVVERDNGKHDRYCGTVYKNVDTPCRHIITNSRFYIIQTKDFWTSLRKNIAASAVILPMDAVFWPKTGYPKLVLPMSEVSKSMTKDPMTNGRSKEANKITTGTRIMLKRPQEDFFKSLRMT
jgi:hypothetical protein